jgi:hypothetical protein
MLMKISLAGAIALLAGVAVWPAAAYHVAARTAVCVIALMAALQAGRTDRNLWMYGLVAVALVFNPLVLVELPRSIALAVTLGSLALLAAWLVVLQRTAAVRSASKFLYASDVAP